MSSIDLIHSTDHTPTFEEISGSISGTVATLWKDINGYLQQKRKASRRIAFSRCSGKSGWNVKYQKGGKSLCTLYPEPMGFVTLVVIKLALVPEVMAREKEFTPYVIDMIAEGQPFNSTLWLMIQVTDEHILNDVKTLLDMK